jgi:hypothetical protein
MMTACDECHAEDEKDFALKRYDAWKEAAMAPLAAAEAALAAMPPEQGAAAAFAQEKPDELKAPKGKSKSGILIMSMIRAIDESDEGREIISRLKEEMATKKQQLTDQMARLQEEVRVLREMKPADRMNKQYYDDLEKAMQTQARLEMEKNIFLAKKQDEINRRMQQLLMGAQQAARDEMKARGGEIVLLTKTGPVELATDQDSQQELLYRRVLCADESIDITDAVIARMNDWYKKNRSSLGVPERKEGAAEGDEKEAPKEATKETTGKDKATAKPEKAGS